MPRYAARTAVPPGKAGGPAAAAPQRRPNPPERRPLWYVLQLRAAQSARAEAASAAPSRDGLPASLKAGVEQLSGIAMDDVRVHRNSPEPAKLGALAYAQGSDIHLGPGQERHLPHEAWHVVQQKQGRVRATTQQKGVAVNGDPALEREADAGQARQAAAPALAVRQLKTLPPTQGYSRQNGNRTVYFINGGGKSVATYWQSNTVYRDDSRAEMLRLIARAAGKLGNIVEPHTNWNHRAADSEDENVNFYDPIRVAYRGEYKVNQEAKNTALEYHFGEKFNGYVVRVTDAEVGLNAAEMQEAAPDEVADGRYSHEHEGQEHAGRALAAEADANSLTKIAAEGARWQVIRRNAARVRDSSKIYTNENSNDALTTQVRHVTFKTLWKSWKAAFDKRYDVTDDEIIEVLKEDEIAVISHDGETKPVRTTASGNMNVNYDLCLDEEEPALQTDLNAKTVRMLHYRKNTALDFRTSLGDVNEAVQTLFDAAAAAAALSVEYVGAKVFVCTAALTAQQKPALAGYAAVAQHDTNLTYPTYREHKLAERVGARVLAGDGGKTAYDAEWSEVYKRGLDALYYRLATDQAGDDGKKLGAIEPDADELEGVDVRALIRGMDDDLVLAAIDEAGEDAAIGELTRLFNAALG